MLLKQVSVPPGVRGQWEVKRFEVDDAGARFHNLRAAIKGFGRIMPGWYTGLYHRGAVVMSDTPSEMSDHYEAVRMARGRVLLNGLGLGMVLHNMLLKPVVEHVTVVEKAEEVIALVGPTYTTDPRVRLVHADAYEWTPARGERFNIAWHDIWSDICTDNLPLMSKLKKRYARRVKWQGAWSEDALR